MFNFGGTLAELTGECLQLIVAEIELLEAAAIPKRSRELRKPIASKAQHLHGWKTLEDTAEPTHAWISNLRMRKSQNGFKLFAAAEYPCPMIHLAML